MTAIIIPLNTRRAAAPMLQAAGSVDPLADPLLSGIAAKLAPEMAQAVRRIIAESVTRGVTTAELTRGIVALGIDRRTASGLARTGTAILAADARRRCFSLI